MVSRRCPLLTLLSSPRAVLLEGLNRGTPSLGVRSATGKAVREVEAVREKDAAGLGRVIPKWEKVTASMSAATAPAQGVGSA